MKDQVSLGSQPQYRPQAFSAQIAPAITAKVHSGKMNAMTRYAVRSSVPEEGTRSSGPLSRPSLPSSALALSTDSTEATVATSNAPAEITAAVTGDYSRAARCV